MSTNRIGGVCVTCGGDRNGHAAISWDHAYLSAAQAIRQRDAVVAAAAAASSVCDACGGTARIGYVDAAGVRHRVCNSTCARAFGWGS